MQLSRLKQTRSFKKNYPENGERQHVSWAAKRNIWHSQISLTNVGLRKLSANLRQSLLAHTYIPLYFLIPSKYVRKQAYFYLYSKFLSIILTDSGVAATVRQARYAAPIIGVSCESPPQHLPSLNFTGRARKSGNAMRYRHVDAPCEASGWCQLLSWKMLSTGH